ncbi:conserved hypothetical protein [Gammaproteobacteria bacterium]
MTLPLFSTEPGCREAHLERRYKNPLFPEADRQVTQEEANRARQADDEEVTAFRKDLRTLLREVSVLPAHVESEVALKLKERIERLYEICAGLPGEFTREREGLIRLSRVIAKPIVDGAANDSYARQQLAQEETAREIHWQLLRHPLVAHLLRPDSPITPADLVPTLLSEDEKSVRAVITLLDSGQHRLLQFQARQWLERLQSEGVQIPPSAWMILEVIEEPIVSTIT